MSDLYTLRKAVVSAFQAALPADVHVESTPGRFDLRALKQRRVRVPAVLVAVMDVTTAPIGESLGVDATADMAAFVLTGGDRLQTADERALLLQSMLLPLVDLADWGIDCEPATDVRGRNLHSSELTEQFSVSLAAVTWQQTIQLGGDDAEPGQSPRDVWLTYEPDEFDERETPATTQIEGADA